MPKDNKKVGILEKGKMWWRMQRREADLTYLWPELARGAHELKIARDAFFLHAKAAEYWTKEYTDEELRDFVNSLEHPKYG